MAEKPYEPSLPIGTVKRLMKENFPEGHISAEAITEMEKTLTQVLKNVTKKAGLFATSAKRKTIQASDIELACKD
jgi:histone H3/H4